MGGIEMKTRFFATIVLAIFVAACALAAKPLAAQNGIEIESARLRLPGAAMAGMSSDVSLAGFAVIKNTGGTDDRLVGARADFAGMAMLHESSIDSNGVASMQAVEAIDLPAGQTVTLEPGGYHLMFMNLKQDLKVGDQVTIVLQFENAGTIDLSVPVTDR
jgi:copper(I)-binding protein